jgi:hypothetical protein
VLFKRDTLDKIAQGSITLAFRRWARPTVKSGGRLRTAIGELAIDDIRIVAINEITPGDAKRAGCDSTAAVIASLREGSAPIYRIALRLAGTDPRVALRKRSALSAADIREIAAKLARMDARSPSGPWTLRVLKLIAKKPAVRATELAAMLQQKTLPFKTRVRRLKELGLTESLDVGYRLSPRGKAVLQRLG